MGPDDRRLRPDRRGAAAAHSLHAGGSDGGNFSIYQNDGSADGWAYGSLHIAHVSITSGGVHEPASWVLLIAGFGLVAATLRRPDDRGVIRR